MAAVIAVVAGVRAGICITAAPRSIRSVRAPIHGEHGRCVRAVGLGDPRDRIPEPVRLDGGDEVVRVVPRAPVSEVDPELHAPKGIGRGIAVPGGTGG